MPENLYEVRITPLPMERRLTGNSRKGYDVFDVVWEVWFWDQPGEWVRLSGDRIRWDAAGVWDEREEDMLPGPDQNERLIQIAKGKAEAYIDLLNEHHEAYVYTGPSE